MERISIGGVDEHFNYPWKKVVEAQRLQSLGIDLRWIDVPGGTGDMTGMLDRGELDMAVLLTEGLIPYLLRHRKVYLLKFHVKSPLRWGIHVANDGPVKQPEAIFSHRFAISRPGSGSQLMAQVHARNKGLRLRDDQFVTVGSLQGGLEALQQKKAEIFLWEKFTTQPFLETYSLHCIDEVPTPWPSFALAVNRERWNANPEKIRAIAQAVSECIKELETASDTTSVIAQRYGLTFAATQRWLRETVWSKESGVSEKELATVLRSLVENGLLTADEANVSAEEIAPHWGT